MTHNGVVYPFRREELGYLKIKSLEEYIKQYFSKSLRPLILDRYLQSIDEIVDLQLSYCDQANQTELI